MHFLSIPIFQGSSLEFLHLFLLSLIENLGEGFERLTFGSP